MAREVGNADPRWRIALGILALALLGLGVRSALGPDPRAAWTLNRASRLLESGRSEEALERLASLVAVEPGDPGLLQRAGRLLGEAGHPLEATVALRRASELDPDSHRARYELAKAYLAAGYPAHAESTLAEVIARKRDHADALNLAASLAAREGRVESAVLTLARAFANEPSHPDRYRWDPSFDPIRNDPRFVRAIQELRMADAWVVEEE